LTSWVVVGFGQGSRRVPRRCWFLMIVVEKSKDVVVICLISTAEKMEFEE
jgi:hypothetical protein